MGKRIASKLFQDRLHWNRPCQEEGSSLSLEARTLPGILPSNGLHQHLPTGIMVLDFSFRVK
jgi:hypothetical protein